MEKMREEFEDAYWLGGVPFNVVGPRDAMFAKKDDGSYRLPYVEGAWWGWHEFRTSDFEEQKNG